MKRLAPSRAAIQRRPRPRPILLLALLAVALLAAHAQAATVCANFNGAGPAGPANQLFVDSFVFDAARLPATGAPVPISIRHVYPFGAPDTDFDLEIPWTESNAGLGAYAKIHFDPAVHGAGVDAVTIVASHQNFLEFAAIDASGAMVGPWQPHTAGQGNLQNFAWTVGSGAPRIARILVRGSEIAITKVCVEDDVPPPPPSDCIDIAGMPAGLVSNAINIDGVIFARAILPDGVTPVPVEIRDNFLGGGDGIHEVNIPWSQPAGGAMQHAYIYFPATQFGKGPIKVEILGAHFNQLDLVAYDGSGAPVGFAGHPGPQNAWATLVLNNPGGIRKIEVIGAELGIQELCYELDPDIPDPDGCVDAATAPLGGKAHLFVVNDVEFEGAFDPTGAPLDIQITDNLVGGAAPDGVREFFYGWSYPVPGATTAKIRFPAAVFAKGPSRVEIVCSRSTTLDLVAYDASGGVLGMQSVTAPALQLETIVFNNPHVREIELIGDQFWVQEICWYGPYGAVTAAPLGTKQRVARLNAPSPNPFNPRTSVSFSLDAAGPVQLDVIDLRGRRVAQLAQGQFEAGDYAFVWDGQDDRGMPVASGVYLMRLRAAGEVQIQRAALLK